SWNRYAYVLNNPLRYIDPWGTDPQDPNDPKPNKNNQLINPDGKPYELPKVEVTTKIKMSKGEPIGTGGGWGDGIAIIAGGGIAGGGAAAGTGTTVGGGIAGGAAGAGVTKGGGGQDGDGGQGDEGDNSNNPPDYPTIDPFEVRFTHDTINNK